MKRYWVSMIVQDKGDRRAWLLEFYDSIVDSIEAGIEAINKTRENYTVLSAWIDTFDEDSVKHTVFHECYVNALGYVLNGEEKYVRI